MISPSVPSTSKDRFTQLINYNQAQMFPQGQGTSAIVLGMSPFSIIHLLVGPNSQSSHL